jgi:C-terminal AAA-associated domain
VSKYAHGFRSVPGLSTNFPRTLGPLVRAICRALEATSDGTLGESFFLDVLRRGFSEDEARQQLRIAIDWGRYGELFDFDADTGQFRLEPATSEDGRADLPAGARAG